MQENPIPLMVTLHTDMAGIPDHTLHGKWIGGTFKYTDMSAGRIGRSTTLTDHTHVTAVTELQNGQDLESQRTILLGEGVIYQYEGVGMRVKNTGGILMMDVGTWGAGSESWEPITPGLAVGGSMPNTVFEIREEPGFAFV